jgi:hypothetical protein
MPAQEFTTEELESEEWRPVVGFEAAYSVSSLGRIRREKRAKSTKAGRTLSYRVGNHGYPVTTLTVNCKGAKVTVHSLVAAAFLGPRPDGYQVNHIDGKKLNARANNLEYATPAANIHHAFKTGLAQTGERHHLAKLTEPHAREIVEHLKRGILSCAEIARQYGVHRTTISHMRNGKGLNRWF